MSEKILCLIAYVFSLPGALVVRFLGRNSKFCLHHARRSLELFGFSVFLFIAWYIGGRVLMLIPYAGFPIAIALFAIVMAALLFSAVLCVMAIIKALRGKRTVFPLISAWMERIEPVFVKIGLGLE
jgi:uncharacterized membrane protein